MLRKDSNSLPALLRTPYPCGPLSTFTQDPTQILKSLSNMQHSSKGTAERDCYVDKPTFNVVNTSLELRAFQQLPPASQASTAGPYTTIGTPSPLCLVAPAPRTGLPAVSMVLFHKCQPINAVFLNHSLQFALDFHHFPWSYKKGKFSRTTSGSKNVGLKNIINKLTLRP